MAFNRVLITGAAGALGRLLRARLAGRFPHLRLSDVADLGRALPGEELVWCDLADADAVERLCRNVDAVIHLGARSREARWETIIASNVMGSVNLFDGARRAGTDRILFASTNHVVGLYERGSRLDHTTPPMPDSRYGVSKAFGEDVARLYALKHGVRAFCMRLGTVAPAPTDERSLSTWLSHRDFGHLVDVGLTAEYVFEIVYGVSDNRRSWWDNANARRLGFAPLDDAETFAAALASAGQADPVAARFQGGTFAAAEFDGALAWPP